ncbi:Condensin complex subunit 1 [Diplonema papillatum]|nr:Condensin complex subunit 1 [Diplonema papillatum]
MEKSFFIPRRVEDLEADTVPAGFLKATPLALDHLEQDGIVAEIRQLSARLHDGGTQRAHASFDVLYSLSKDDMLGNMEPPTLQTWTDTLASCLQTTVKQQEQLAPDNTAEYRRDFHEHLTAARIYGWCLCRAATHSERKVLAVGGQAGNAFTPGASKRGGKKAGKRVPDKEDPAKVAGKAKEGILRALVQSVALRAANQVSASSAASVEDKDYWCLLMALAALYLQNPYNLRSPVGKSVAPVREALFELLLALAKEFDRDEQAPAGPRPSTGGAEPEGAGERPAEVVKNAVNMTIVESTARYDHLPRYTAMLCKEAEGYQETWSSRVVDSILQETVEQSKREGGETTEAKNIGAFVTDLAELLPGVIERNLSTLHGSLASDSFAIRKAVLNCYAQLLLAERSPAARADDESTAQKREGGQYGDKRKPTDGLLDVILERVHDVNSWVRICVLNNIKLLWGAHAIGAADQPKALQAVVGRILDRNSFVRHSAMACLAASVSANSFGEMLKLSAYQTHHQAIVAKREETERLRHHHAASAAEGPPPPLPTEQEDAQQRSKLQFYESAEDFIITLHRAIPPLLSVLSSRSATDTAEAVKTLTVLVRFKVEPAVATVLRIAVQIFNCEQSVQEIVVDSFMDIIAGPGVTSGATSEADSALRVTQQLIRVVSSASEGEVSAVCEVLSRVGGDFCEQFADTAWTVAREASDPDEARVAARLYSIFAQTSPDLATDRLSELTTWGLADKGRRDPVFATRVLDTLSCSTLSPGFSKLPLQDPVFKHVSALLLAPCRSIAAWVPLAKAAVAAVFALADNPAKIVEKVVALLSSRFDRLSAAVRADEEKAKAEAETVALFEKRASGGAAEPVADPESNLREARHALARLLFLLGESSIRQVALFEVQYKAALAKIHDTEGRNSAESADEPKKAKKGKGPAVKPGEPAAIEDELGLESKGAKENEAEEKFRDSELRILSRDTVWGRHLQLVVSVCLKPLALYADPSVKSCAVLAYCMMMLASEDFARKHAQYLFSILKAAVEPSIRVNIIVAVGDLISRWPNTMERWTAHFFDSLLDRDVTVRGTAFLVASHLILNDMIKARSFVHALLAGLVDSSDLIKNRASLFLREYSSRGRVFGALPDALSALSRRSDLPEGGVRSIMKLMLDHIDKDKQTELLVQRLCLKFTQITDPSSTDAVPSLADGVPSSTSQPQTTSPQKAAGESPEGEVGGEALDAQAGPDDSSRPTVNLMLARHIAECLSLLDIKQTSERVVKRLVSAPCFKCYAPYLSDAQIVGYLKDIANRVRRVVPGSKERADVKTIVDEWEKNIDEEVDKRCGANAVEVKARAQALRLADKAAKTAANRKKRKGDDDDADDNASADSPQQPQKRAKTAKPPSKPAKRARAEASESSAGEEDEEDEENEETDEDEEGEESSEPPAKKPGGKPPAKKGAPKPAGKKPAGKSGKPAPKAKRARKAPSPSSESSGSGGDESSSEAESSSSDAPPAKKGRAAAKPKPKPKPKPKGKRNQRKNVVDDDSDDS